MSDLTLAGTATLSHEIPPGELLLQRLSDHAEGVWFRRPFPRTRVAAFSVESSVVL